MNNRKPYARIWRELVREKRKMIVLNYMLTPRVSHFLARIIGFSDNPPRISKSLGFLRLASLNF
ncbi:hypothetical protein BMS3Abin10_01576 [bacterium BMS3Abin10]|nr:hypothetical protein BMS3Abin10_01576 [bacterium BMS3Abin10]GBE39277.1 hypothetical protein BMS3Bbin08_01899 [bacterium BMS3Bbin08]